MRESRWLPLEPARRAPRSLVPWSFSGSHGAPSPKARECEPHRTRTASRKARPAKAFSWTRGLAIADAGRTFKLQSGQLQAHNPCRACGITRAGRLPVDRLDEADRAGRGERAHRSE